MALTNAASPINIQIKKLFLHGLSYNVIAIVFNIIKNETFTNGFVAGRCNRLGLTREIPLSPIENLENYLKLIADPEKIDDVRKALDFIEKPYNVKGTLKSRRRKLVIDKAMPIKKETTEGNVVILPKNEKPKVKKATVKTEPVILKGDFKFEPPKMRGNADGLIKARANKNPDNFKFATPAKETNETEVSAEALASLERKTKKPPKPIEEVFNAQPLANTKPKTLMQLKPCDCRWPLERNKKNEQLFCAKARQLSSVYWFCDEHLKAAINPGYKKREDLSEEEIVERMRKRNEMRKRTKNELKDKLKHYQGNEEFLQ